MKVLRVHITGWVSSFRNPLFISGFQPTLPLPPLSALYGLLTAAKGDWVTPHDAAIGYVFQNKGKAVDLETIYEFGGKLDAKSNVNRREFLVQPELYLYTPEMWIREVLERPHYSLLMGRSSDLATVKSIEEIELESKSETTYQNTILPFPDSQLHGQVQALPTHFTAEIPRKPCGIRAYCLVTEAKGIKYQGDVLHDADKEWGVYLHKRIPGEFIVPVEKSTKPVDKDYQVPKINGEQMPLFDS